MFVRGLFQSLSLEKMSDIHSDLNIPIPDPINFNDNGTDEVMLTSSLLEPGTIWAASTTFYLS